MKQGEHFTEKGILKIIGLKSSLNWGLPDNLTNAFPPKAIVHIPRPVFVFKGIPDPFWISGFTSGDGSFNLKIGSSATTSIGVRIQLRFGIGLHIRELDVIRGLANYFNSTTPLASKRLDISAAVVESSSLSTKNISILSKVVNFQITNFSDIIDIIIPFFEKYPIQGIKALDFEDFKRVAEIMKTKNHLTKEGGYTTKILKIKQGMNQNRF